jgi:hypothetical protein
MSKPSKQRLLKALVPAYIDARDKGSMALKTLMDNALIVLEDSFPKPISETDPEAVAYIRDQRKKVLLSLK